MDNKIRIVAVIGLVVGFLALALYTNFKRNTPAESTASASKIEDAQPADPKPQLDGPIEFKEYDWGADDTSKGGTEEAPVSSTTDEMSAEQPVAVSDSDTLPTEPAQEQLVATAAPDSPPASEEQVDEASLEAWIDDQDEEADIAHSPAESLPSSIPAEQAQASHAASDIESREPEGMESVLDIEPTVAEPQNINLAVSTPLLGQPPRPPLEEQTIAPALPTRVAQSSKDLGPDLEPAAEDSAAIALEEPAAETPSSIAQEEFPTEVSSIASVPNQAVDSEDVVSMSEAPAIAESAENASDLVAEAPGKPVGKPLGKSVGKSQEIAGPPWESVEEAWPIEEPSSHADSDAMIAEQSAAPSSELTDSTELVLSPEPAAPADLASDAPAAEATTQTRSILEAPPEPPALDADKLAAATNSGLDLSSSPTDHVQAIPSEEKTVVSTEAADAMDEPKSQNAIALAEQAPTADPVIEEASPKQEISPKEETFAFRPSLDPIYASTYDVILQVNGLDRLQDDLAKLLRRSQQQSVKLARLKYPVNLYRLRFETALLDRLDSKGKIDQELPVYRMRGRPRVINRYVSKLN